MYYLLGMYKDSSSKSSIETKVSQLKALSENNSKMYPDSYIRQGLFTTDELILLNNTEHRFNFVGPYTACLRLLIASLPGISGNATLREDLTLFDK